MQNILVFDASRKKRGELTKCLRSCMKDMGTRHLKFLYFDPMDVFKGEIPETARAAFFTLEDMNSAEAARKFGQYRKNIPLVIVSDTDEYAGESWNYGARFYLLFPLEKERMRKAIERCDRGW